MRNFFALCLSAAVGCGAPHAPASTTEARPPNVVFILADDLGWGQLGCYGSDFYSTPHIDQLAAEGLRFTQAYSAAAICSPTRAALWTGKSPARLHLTTFLPGDSLPQAALADPDWQRHLPLQEFTLGELFQQAGYATALFGKWHLSESKTGPTAVHQGPAAQGFAEHFLTYKPDPKWVPVGPWQHPEGDPHNVDTLSTLAVDFMARHQEEPFLLVVSHNAVHNPLMASQERIDHFAADSLAAAPENHPTLAAMVEHLDRGVGQVLAAIDSLGLRQNTLVVFYSDNGGKEAVAAQSPWRAGKGWLYEGGIRVPLVARLPGTVPVSVSEALVTSTDFFPTLAAAAGLGLPAQNTLDGHNLWPHWSEGQPAPQRDLYWHFPHYHRGSKMPPASAVRAGDFKLIQWHEPLLLGDSASAYELYHLAHDPGETTNLAAAEPDQTQRMARLLETWKAEHQAQMPTPKHTASR